MTLLEMTLSGAVFILAIAAFRAVALRRLPKGTFVGLWWAASARLLIPLELPSRFSVYSLLEAPRPGAEAVLAQAVPSSPGPGQVFIIPSGPLPAAAPSPEPFPVWTALWAAGAALLGIWFLVRYVRWRRRFRESLPAEGCRSPDTRLRRKVQVRVTDRIRSPLTYGVLRPVILLPRTLDLGDEEAVTCVLAHELAHIRRLDGLFKLALAAALCVHWFNPAVWLMYVLASRDMELRCDEAAVLSLGGDERERYALALIRMAELRNEYVPLCGFSHKSGMEERIRAIMSIKKKSLLACALALILALGITTAFATSAKPAGKAGAPEEDPDARFYAETSAAVSAEWDEVLAPYVPFGLTYEFDDPDHDGNGLTMWFEGREVRGVFDERSGAWITERSGNGTYGEGATELYAIYDDGGLTGLRFASEEERAEWTAARERPALGALGESVRCDGGNVYFTIPEGEGHWGVFISGRIVTEDGAGLSVHYLEDVEEWVPGETYFFETADAAYDELTLSAARGEGAEWEYFDLLPLLPEGRAPLDLNLPEGKADVPEGTEMVWPVDSDKITNSFGDRANPGGEGVTHHGGVDIGGLERGAPIYAAGSGTVKEAGFDSVLGNYVRVAHSSSVETLYAHCRSVEVKTGDAVEAGQTIATVGSTGYSTGPHLHFEVLLNGVQQNPMTYFEPAPAEA